AVVVPPAPAPSPLPASAGSSGDAPTQPLPAPPPPLVPEYDLLRCIGQGAYGDVWLARNVVGLYVAVKIVRRHRFAGDGPFEREFKGVTKFMPLSRSHPGLVQLLHVGRNQAADYFYYVMEAADDEAAGQRIHPDTYQARVLGRDLQQRGRLSILECLRLSIALADALAYLHQHQLIHRYIKPNNVIFVNGQPKFADVGLVTDVQTEGHEVSFLGTEGYIAPEGPGAKVSDIYSLGRLIYMAAMGRDQRQFPDLPTALVQGADPVPVLRLNKIILTACQVNPSARYQSAEELRGALKELLHDLEGGGGRREGSSM
ncbi:MAG TPA: serine/threonine-protein kinase, partial [Candidatus Saccharimonadales bacterium]|nr:serine/threonine-protein kinase [Candidatus Saccharimonadales bacterium]